MDIDFTLIENASLLAFALVFIGGILTSIGPCNVAMIPLVVGYVGGSRGLPRIRAFSLSLMFAIGLALTFMLLGVGAAPIGGLLGFFLLRSLNASASLSALLLVYVALGVTMMTISSFWKISLHAGGVGGFAAFLTWMFGPVWALAFLALPLIGWARVYRKRHNWAQVVAGGIVGAFVTWIVLALVQ